MGVAVASMSDQVVAACKKEWDANQSNCSGFVKAVAADLGIHFSGQANDIIQYIRANWRSAKDGAGAALQAANGFFVIGGLEDEPNGHVVVVVPGALDRGQYPHAYWGTLGGVGKKDETINWSWSAEDRDKVEYHYHDFAGVGQQSPGPVQARFIGWSPEQLLKDIRQWL